MDRVLTIEKEYSMKKVLVILISFIPSLVFAKHFHKFAVYDANASYTRGDVVRHNHHLWISRFGGSKQFEPKKGNLKWVKVQIDNISQWQKRKVYRLGKSVKHNGKYYVSTRLMSVNINNKHADKKWVEFAHPAMGYDLPKFDTASEQATSLLGIDTNQNNIRDDYEIKTIMIALPKKTTQYALTAGEIYGSLMKTSEINYVYTPENTEKIINSLVLAKACKVEQAKLNGSNNTWRESHFFNTFDRVKAKFELQNRLSEQLIRSRSSISIENACEQLSKLIMEVK